MSLKERVCIKRLDLVRPDDARSLGLVVDRPVFISPTDSTDSKPLIYRVGHTIKASFLGETGDLSLTTYKGEVEADAAWVHSRPKSGMGYHEFPAEVMTRLPQVNYTGWVAVVEPVGRILEHQDKYFAFDRITDQLVVREILALCEVCRSGPLSIGFVADIREDGMLSPICGADIHNKYFVEDPSALSPNMLFEIGDDKQVILRATS